MVYILRLDFAIIPSRVSLFAGVLAWTHAALGCEYRVNPTSSVETAKCSGRCCKLLVTNPVDWLFRQIIHSCRREATCTLRWGPLNALAHAPWACGLVERDLSPRLGFR